MKGLLSNSIRTQLQVFFIVALGLAVLVMGGVWLNHNQDLHQSEAEHVLTAKADLIGAVLKPALIFNDKRLARELLASSQLGSEVLTVCLFTAEGKTLLNFPFGHELESIPFQQQGKQFYNGRLKLYRAVSHKGSPVGVIYIESSLSHMHENERAGLYAVLLAVLGSLVLGLYIAARMQKKISEPITELATLMRRLGSEHNYSLRAEESATCREIQDLSSGFNQMAEKIQTSFFMIEEQHVHLKESEERFRSIAESAPMPIVICRPDDGYILFCNHAAMQLFGVKRDMADGLHSQDLYYNPNDRQIILDKIAEQGEIRGYELQAKKVDGSPVWISLSMFQTEFEHEKALFSAFSDITGQKSIEQLLEQRVVERTHELHKAKETLQSTLDNLLDTYYRINADGTVNWTSKSIETLLGYQAEEIEGTHLRRLFWDKNNFRKTVEAQKNTEVPVVNFEVQLSHKDGHKIWGTISSHLLYDSNSRITGAEGVLRNVTEQKLAEQEKKNMEKKLADVQRLESLGVLAGGIAHDFNNLLAAIMGNAELAELKQASHESINGELKGIISCSMRAASLCNQMLDYAGQGIIMKKQIDLSELVDKIIQLIDVSISKYISLELNLARSLPVIHVDETQMQQVIMNLVTNASEAIGDKPGQIAISTGVTDAQTYELESEFIDIQHVAGQYVYLEVSDTGGGMDEATRKRMFDPFFTTKFTGRGLGLSALLGIVRSHHGTVQVDSQLGHGTRTRILLPQHEEYMTAADEDYGLDNGQAECVVSTVLVIDDEAEVLASAQATMEKLGCRVLTAGDGIEGLSIYQEAHESINLVLLDMTMPRMNGMETLAKLREIEPRIPVIICSGYGYANLSDQFKDFPPEGFLHKPYSINELKNILGQSYSSVKKH